MYCDTSKIVIERCNKETVYNIVKKRHYAKTCSNFGIDFVSYKYISDKGDVEDWKENCSKGIEEFKKVLEHYDNF